MTALMALVSIQQPTWIPLTVLIRTFPDAFDAYRELWGRKRHGQSPARNQVLLWPQLNDDAAMCGNRLILARRKGRAEIDMQGEIADTYILWAIVHRAIECHAGAYACHCAFSLMLEYERRQTLQHFVGVAQRIVRSKILDREWTEAQRIVCAEGVKRVRGR